MNNLLGARIWSAMEHRDYLSCVFAIDTMDAMCQPVAS